jgi:hypothetical protein
MGYGTLWVTSVAPKRLTDVLLTAGQSGRPGGSTQFRTSTGIRSFEQ